MKNVILSLTAVITTIMAGCSKVETPTVPDSLTPIALTAGVQATTNSRAAVTGTTFPENTTNVFGVTAFSHATTAPSTDWSATPYFDNVAVNSGAASALTFNTNQYYPANGDKVYFYAYAPTVSSLTAGTSFAAPIAAYTITGQEDIMAAQVVTGIAKVSTGTQSQPAFAFTHKLMQLRFKVVADASFETGKTVTEVLIKNVKTSAKLSIDNGSLTFDDAAADKTLSLPITAGTKDEITTAGTEMNNSVMCAPVGAAGEVILKITADGVVYDNVVVILTGTNSGEAGTSHLITLTFKRSSITVSASITDWTDTGRGSTDIGGSGNKYPYVVDGSIIISKDGIGSSAGPFHDKWSVDNPMPDHSDLDITANTISAKLEVANSDSPCTETSPQDNNHWKWSDAMGVGAPSVSACPKGWRIPTLAELKLIIEQQNALVNVDPIKKIDIESIYATDARYWSSTKDGDRLYFMIRASFYNDIWNYSETDRDSFCYVRCVRDL